MASCNGKCGDCKLNCNDRKEDFILSPNENSKIKKLIGVVSGKGGVGKSTVTSLLAVASANLGYSTAIMDADITGPSIPQAFGIHENARGTDEGIIPALGSKGIKVMSVNLLLEREDQPVIWRGPVLTGLINQFWQEVIWGDVDYMFVDMPPGTGDVPLTVFQSLPLDGIIIVTTPQDLVTLIVKKAVNMAKMMNVPIIGIIENMSYFICSDCGKRHNIFGESKLESFVKEEGISFLAQIPLNEESRLLVDKGKVELADTRIFEDIIKKLE